MFCFIIITEKPVEVLRVATKGQDKAGAKGWVTKYLISLSTNGSIFTHYMEGGKEKVSLLFMSLPSPQFIQPINPGIPIWRMQDSCFLTMFKSKIYRKWAIEFDRTMLESNSDK